MNPSLDKATLLTDMHTGYDTFTRLLGLLIPEQMMTPGVNGNWSIKDNIAHLTAWQQQVINMLQAIRQNVDLPDPTPNMTEDEENELFYQQYQAELLDSVLAEFHATSKRFIDEVRATSEEDLRKPVSWLDDHSVWRYIPGNQYEHFQEHAHIIRVWLAQNSNAQTEPRT